jgi:hypothetical protein
MAMSPVLTRGYDNARSNCTYNETILTADNVRKRGIVRLYSIPLMGDDRGTEAQPLIAPNIETADGYTHDLLLVPTMGNMLYAFDANAPTPTLVWAMRLGNPIAGGKRIDEWGINTNWGILGTPVIDLEDQVIYSVIYTSLDGDYTKGAFYLHANRLYDGAHVTEPLSLEDATDVPGNGIKPNVFSGVQRKQRCALLMTNINKIKTVFVCAGSIFESLASNLGWVIAVDVTSFSIKAAWTSCPKNGGGGIWMAGQGPAANNAGDIMFVTGNGNFDDVTDKAESACRLQYDPKAGTLKLVDWVTPFTDDMRDGQEAPPGMPTNMNGWDDQDLGSSGLTYIEDLGYVIFSGKDGIAYVARVNQMGKTTLAQLQAGKQYDALAWPPIWFTYYPGPDVDPAPADPTKLNFNWGGVTHHMHSSAAYYKPERKGRHLVYCWGENGNLRSWNLQLTGELRYRACSVETASPDQPGMPGGMITISADASDPNSGIVWGLVPYRDANRVISPGRLLAYSATNVLDGGIMEKLWDSEQWRLGFTHNKFDVTSVSGGRLFVPTYSATIDVWGLTPP